MTGGGNDGRTGGIVRIVGVREGNADERVVPDVCGTNVITGEMNEVDAKSLRVDFVLTGIVGVYEVDIGTMEADADVAEVLGREVIRVDATEAVAIEGVAAAV